MKQIPYEQWPSSQQDPRRSEVWLDEGFLAQVFREDGDILRVSVNRVFVGEDGITWEELMEVKRRIGRGEDYAVEVLPRDRDIVNVANMRHIWIMPHPVCGWFKEPTL